MNECLRGPKWSRRGKKYRFRHPGGVTLDKRRDITYAERWQMRSRAEGWNAPWPGDSEGIPKYHINAHGWRSNTTGSTRGRVWFVGCSETFAQSVTQGETMVEHYERITGLSALNLGWPGGSNSWNAHITISRMLAEGAPDWVFFQWTKPARFYFYTPSGKVAHWGPTMGNANPDISRKSLEYNTQEPIIESRQLKAYKTLNEAFSGRITHWSGFGQNSVNEGLPKDTIVEWGMPRLIPEDLAQDAAHSNAARHLRWAKRAAEIKD